MWNPLTPVSIHASRTQQYEFDDASTCWKPFQRSLMIARSGLRQRVSRTFSPRGAALAYNRVMAQQNSFDITSQIDHAEVVNAIHQALKEVQTRFDFKDSKSNIEVESKEAVILSSDDEYRLKSLNDILQTKFVKRNVPLKGLTYGKIEAAAGGTVRQHITLQQGIPQDKAKEIVKFIKDSKVKVQASIQGDLVRVSGKDRDTLQEVIGKLRAHDFGIDMQFGNYRSN
jgi:uncharacterized protein YajQ (UPF0234 family)